MATIEKHIDQEYIDSEPDVGATVTLDDMFKMKLQYEPDPGEVLDGKIYRSNIIHHWFTIPTELIPYLTELKTAKHISHWDYTLHRVGEEEDGTDIVDGHFMDLYFFYAIEMEDDRVYYHNGVLTLDEAISEAERILTQLRDIYITLKQSTSQSAGMC